MSWMKGAEGEVERLAARVSELESLLRARTSEHERDRQFLETAGLVSFRISPDGVVEYINRVQPGYPDPVGRSIYSFAPPDHHERMRAAIARAAATLQPASYESVAYTPDGRHEWYITNIGPILEGGELVALAMVSTNATRVRQAELSLEESRAKTQLTLDAGGVGVWRWDRDTDVVEWDDRLTAMFGVAPEQTPRTVAAYLALIPADQRQAMSEHIQRALVTGVYPDFELRADHPQGPRWFIIKGGMLRDTDGKITGLLGGVIDVTQRRHTEERLRQTQKLEAVGQLAAGVAHNFNNMLAVITTSLELLKRKGVVVPTLIDNALAASTNAAELVRQLVMFSTSRSVRDGRREPLAEVVRRAVALCRQTFEPWVQLDVGPLEAADAALVDAAAMEQVIVNLLLNARDALSPDAEGGARIEITAEASVRERHVELQDAYVELRIRDTGHGMDSATRARVFEPFFTTKPTGRGTGLGLSTAWATVVAHRGVLECASEPASGTTFSMRLPRTSPAPPSSATTPGAGAGSRPDKIVLIVDDQDAVRRSHAMLLQDAGFTVVEASSGAEALELAAQTAVDVVLLDYAMPGLSAEETLRRLSQIRPGLSVVSLSGMGAELEGVTAHLVKPVSYDALVEALMRALRGA